MHNTSYYHHWFTLSDMLEETVDPACVCGLDKIPHTVFYGKRGRFFASAQIRFDRVDALVQHFPVPVYIIYLILINTAPFRARQS